MTILQYFHHVDQDLTLVVNSWGGSMTDWIWILCSDKLVWIPFYLFVLFLLIKRLGWKKATVCAIACILTIVACDQLGNLVKNSVQRLRPCWDMNMLDRGLRILEDKGGKYGFYSAHAANAAGFAMCSLKSLRLDHKHRYGAYGWIAFIWTLLIGISRVFVGKHFLGDVVTGIVVGVIVGYALAEMAKVVIRRFSL